MCMHLKACTVFFFNHIIIIIGSENSKHNKKITKKYEDKSSETHKNITYKIIWGNRFSWMLDSLCFLYSFLNLQSSTRKDTGISRIYIFINQIHNKLEALTNKMTKYFKNFFPLYKDVLLKFKLFKTTFQLSVGQLIHVYCTQLTVKNIV